MSRIFFICMAHVFPSVRRIIRILFSHPRASNYNIVLFLLQRIRVCMHKNTAACIEFAKMRRNGT